MNSFRKRVIAANLLTEAELAAVRAEVDREIEEATDRAIAAPTPPAESALWWVYSSIDPTSREFDSPPEYGPTPNPNKTMVDLLNSAHVDEMARDPRIVVFGEDVADCSREDNLDKVKGKGGVFKVTHNLQRRHGSDRVYNTPLAEANIVGRAIGLATRGLKPVAEIQFFDYMAGPRTCRLALEDSLARLGRSTIDLYQIHFPSRRVSIPRLMNLMADAVETGKVRAVGVSNYSAEEMCLAHAELAKRGIPLASNQVQCSLLHRNPEVDGVLEACRELGVTLIAYSPLAMGALTGKYSSGAKANGLRRFLAPNFRGKGIEAVQPVVELLREIGKGYSKTPSQVDLRWLIENAQVLPIPVQKTAGRRKKMPARCHSHYLQAKLTRSIRQL